MAFAEDFSVFFNTDGFGVECVYTPNTGPSHNFTGIFDNGYFSVPGGEVDVAGRQPQLVYESAALPSEPVFGEGITVDGQDFTIIGIHPDGTGSTVLLLELAT